MPELRERGIDVTFVLPRDESAALARFAAAGVDTAADSTVAARALYGAAVTYDRYLAEPDSAAFYREQLIARYPDSPQAYEAREAVRAGADVVMTTSALLRYGPEHLRVLREGVVVYEMGGWPVPKNLSAAQKRAWRFHHRRGSGALRASALTWIGRVK